MAPFQEVVQDRTRTSKTFVDPANPGRRSWVGGLATIHYESVPDSGAYDAEVDFSPRRVNDAQLDGWVVTESGWHYALGKPGDKPTDGWVGFGGRQGAHWVKFRLARVGYLHGPTRAWEDLGGPPTYDRAKLSSETQPSEYGHGALVNVQTTAAWSDIWTTPNGGALDVRWRASGDGLKEDIVINQAAREWLAANRPPSTPAAETWFGFVLQVDWSDIPKAVRAGLEEDLAGDFTDGGEAVELRDALDRLLAFMPVSEVRVPSSDPAAPDDVRLLEKRFWLDGDGNHYVLVGVRVSELAGMAAGDLVFDPTVDEQVGAGADDGLSRRPSGNFDATGAFVQVGKRVDGTDFYELWARFTTVGIPNGATIDVAYLTVEAGGTGNDGVGVLTDIFFNDIDDAVAPTTQAEHEALARTTAFTAWDAENFVIDTPTNSPSIVDAVQEVIDRGGWSLDNSLQVLWDDDGSTTNFFYRFHSYEGDSSKVIKLHIEYTALVILTPTPVTAAFSVPAPTLAPGPLTLALAPISAAWSVPAATVAVSGGPTLTPAPAVAAWVVPSPFLGGISRPGDVTRSLRRGGTTVTIKDR